MPHRSSRAAASRFPKFTAAPTMDTDDRKSSDQPRMKRGFDQKWVQRISKINIQCRFIFFFSNDLFTSHVIIVKCVASALWSSPSLNTFNQQILIQNLLLHQIWSPRLGFSVVNSNTLTKTITVLSVIYSSPELSLQGWATPAGASGERLVGSDTGNQLDQWTPQSVRCPSWFFVF